MNKGDRFLSHSITHDLTHTNGTQPAQQQKSARPGAICISVHPSFRPSANQTRNHVE